MNLLLDTCTFLWLAASPERISAPAQSVLDALAMKATIEIPDALYRRVKAKSALEGPPVREVVMHLFRGWLGEADVLPGDKPIVVPRGQDPTWFGAVRKYAQRVNRHDLSAIRRSIVQGRVHKSALPSSEG